MTTPVAFAQIEPVGQCNLRCQMCAVQFRAAGPPHGPLAFMPLPQFQRLIDQLTDLKQLHLQGLGEPLMHPEFFDMVRYATARGIAVSTNTNLTLLSPRRARLCVDSGLRELHVSLDAASAEIYERIRVGARFSRVCRNLASLQRARAATESEYPKVRIIVVLMRQNLEQLPAIVRLAHDFGVSTVFAQHLCHDFQEDSLPERYRPMREFVDAQTLLGEAPERIARLFAAARAEAGRLGVELRLPRLGAPAAIPTTVTHRRCDWPWRGPYISYTGDTMPCCMVGTPDRSTLGNMLDGDVATVWDGVAYQEFRQALGSDTPPAVCRSCSVYHGVF